MNWNEYSNCLKALFEGIVITDESGQVMPSTEGSFALRRMTQTLKSNRGDLYLIGNGASASMASHVAADMGKNAGVRTDVFTDLALITAVANDISYDEVFAEPLRSRVQAGDMLAAISSSGHSLNILRGAEVVTEMGGNVVTFSAMKEDNPLRRAGKLNFYVPAMTYGTAEICHTAVLHYWIDLMVRANGNGHQPW